MEGVQFIAALVCGGAALASHEYRPLSAVLRFEQEDAEGTESGVASVRLRFLRSLLFKNRGTSPYGSLVPGGIGIRSPAKVTMSPLARCT